MRSLLYLIAVILIIGWLLGVFVYSATGLIHILIVLAIVALLLGIIRRAWRDRNSYRLPVAGYEALASHAAGNQQPV